MQRHSLERQRLRVVKHVQSHRRPDADMAVPDVPCDGIRVRLGGLTDRAADSGAGELRNLRARLKHPAEVQAGLLLVYVEGEDQRFVPSLPV